MCRRKEEGIARYCYKPCLSPESHKSCPKLLILNKIGKLIIICSVEGRGYIYRQEGDRGYGGEMGVGVRGVGGGGEWETLYTRLHNKHI